MTEQLFALIPFPASTIPEISVTGYIAREGNLLVLRYIITGNIADILLPSPVEHPSRKDDLWKMTCLEFFLALKDQPQYWEFNMSPCGDWNVYRMDAYRRVGFRTETSMQDLLFETRQETNKFTLNAWLNLSPLFELDDPLEAGIAAIIQTRDGQETYWALAHPGPQADFHVRESFTLPLGAQTHPLEQSAQGG
jgi:hypothetical protein